MTPSVKKENLFQRIWVVTSRRGVSSHEKGLVHRNTNSKIHLYKAAHQENSTKKGLLNNFIASTFNGSAQSLVMDALGDHKASVEELKAIKNLISQLEKNQ